MKVLWQDHTFLMKFTLNALCLLFCKMAADVVFSNLVRSPAVNGTFYTQSGYHHLNHVHNVSAAKSVMQHPWIRYYAL